MGNDNKNNQDCGCICQPCYPTSCCVPVSVCPCPPPPPCPCEPIPVPCVPQACVYVPVVTPCCPCPPDNGNACGNGQQQNQKNSCPTC